MHCQIELSHHFTTHLELTVTNQSRSGVAHRYKIHNTQPPTRHHLYSLTGVRRVNGFCSVFEMNSVTVKNMKRKNVWYVLHMKTVGMAMFTTDKCKSRGCKMAKEEVESRLYLETSQKSGWMKAYKHTWKYSTNF